MGIVKSSDSSRLRQYVSDFKDVFASDGKVLFSLACRKSIVAQQRSQVTQHLSCSKHIAAIKIRGATGSDGPWPAEQPPLAVFPGCTRRYWVDMWSAHRIPLD
jgi:hypothetical protein